EARKCLEVAYLPKRVCNLSYKELSDGEKERARLARLLSGRESSKIGVLDEFGSHLDPDTRQIVCRNISHYYSHSTQVRVRRLVLVSCCCEDLLEEGTLKPDWVFDTRTLTFTHTADKKNRIQATAKYSEISEKSPEISDKSSKISGKPPGIRENFDEKDACSETPFLRIPHVDLKLVRGGQSEWKRVFSIHHYKSSKLSPRAISYLLMTKTLIPMHVGFIAAIPQSGRFISAVDVDVKSGYVDRHVDRHGDRHVDKEAYRAHRTVILPEWQGMGLGGKLSDTAGEIFRKQGYRYFGQTVHPRFGQYRDRSVSWRALPWNHAIQRYKFENWTQMKTHTQIRLRRPRMIYAHEYIGHEGQRQSYSTT
ncbi:hypothetical protein AAMO2058_001751700, partial [Amorphochlora amoebiformis]